MTPDLITFDAMLIADEDGNCTAPRPRVGGQSNGVVEEVSQGSQDIVATDVTAFQDYGDGERDATPKFV